MFSGCFTIGNNNYAQLVSYSAEICLLSTSFRNALFGSTLIHRAGAFELFAMEINDSFFGPSTLKRLESTKDFSTILMLGSSSFSSVGNVCQNAKILAYYAFSGTSSLVSFDS